MYEYEYEVERYLVSDGDTSNYSSLLAPPFVERRVYTSRIFLFIWNTVTRDLHAQEGSRRDSFYLKQL